MLVKSLSTEYYSYYMYVWFFFRIDHWNNEREKIVLLTEGSILVFKYNFILNKLEQWRRLLLHMIDNIGVGDFRYPDKSLMP